MNNDTPADAMQLKPCPFFHVIKIDGEIFGIRDQGTSMSFPWSESRNDTKDLCEALNSAMEFAFAHRATSLAAQDGLVDALRVIAVGEGCMNGIREELSAAALRKIARAALASIEVKS